MLAPRKSMQADLHDSSLPVRLDHLFFTCRFCLQQFLAADETVLWFGCYDLPCFMRPPVSMLKFS